MLDEFLRSGMSAATDNPAAGKPHPTLRAGSEKIFVKVVRDQLVPFSAYGFEKVSSLTKFDFVHKLSKTSSSPFDH